mmetsp:Transcript_28172/g.65110  ORF Transcript_28172/g.65110 Transcript_28172/m.65110 type:complete len:379 (+) Transcript_28172:89-1225(+)
MTTSAEAGAPGSIQSAWDVNAQGLIGEVKHALVSPHVVVRRETGSSDVQQVGENAGTDIGEIAHVESVPMGSSMVLPGDARVLTEMWEALWQPADANATKDLHPIATGSPNLIHVEEGSVVHDTSGARQVPAAAAQAPAPAGAAASDGGASMLGVVIGLVLLGLLLAMLVVVAVTWLRYKAQAAGGTSWIQDGRASGKYTSLYASRKQMRSANSGTSSSSSVALRGNDNRDDSAAVDAELLIEPPRDENLQRQSSASRPSEAVANLAEQQKPSESDASNRKSRSSEEPRSRSGSQSPTARRSGSNSQDSGADTKDRLRKARNQALLAARASNTSTQRSGSVRADRSPSSTSATGRPSTRRSASRGPKPTDAPAEDLTF